MIQFNLLPDVKLEFVKAQRVKHAVVSGSVIASGVALLIFGLLFIAVHVVQDKVIKDSTKDIKRLNQQLVDTKDIDKILTIQSQLGALPSLHAEKPAASRVFDLARQFTPNGVSLTGLTVDLTANTISIQGISPTFDMTNTMADMLKFMKYQQDDVDMDKAFSNVVLTSFNAGTLNAPFTIDATFKADIFDNDKKIGFVVPSLRSTQSYVGTPDSLFVKPTGRN